MNERIQQLWSQAEEEIKTEYEDESRRNRRLYNEIFLPKFAQLIVKECIDWCNANARDDGTAQRIAEDIKKDFGVEE